MSVKDAKPHPESQNRVGLMWPAIVASVVAAFLLGWFAPWLTASTATAPAWAEAGFAAAALCLGFGVATWIAWQRRSREAEVLREDAREVRVRAERLLADLDSRKPER